MALSIWNFLGALLVGGSVITGLAYGLFRLLGEKWLSSKFDERMASFRHTQNKELEEFKFRINALFDRKTKLHQREFEIVPTAWSLLVDAQTSVAAITSAFQQIVDVDRMNAQQLDEFLKESNLLNWQKDELRSASDKNAYYEKVLFRERYSESRGKCRDIHLYLLKNGIFMSPELKEKFTTLDGIIWGALVEHQINVDHDIRPARRDGLKDFEDRGKKILSSLEQDIRTLLWSDN